MLIDNIVKLPDQEKAKLRKEARKSYNNVYNHSLEHYVALDKELSNFCESVKKIFFKTRCALNTSNH